MDIKNFEYYIETESFHLKFACGAPAVKDKEFHDYHEFVLFMGGKAQFLSKNIQQELTHGALLVIPKEQFHQFVVSEPESYTRCILAFRENERTNDVIGSVMNEMRIYIEPDARIVALFSALTELVSSDASEKEKALFIEGALYQLLITLRYFGEGAVTKNVTVSAVVRDAIDFIDKNYTGELSVPMIAAKLFVSESTLSHKFSHEMNLSIYQYILKKRLISARMRIEAGESYSAAAVNSGFSDYSSFYRAYKKSYK